MYETIKAEVKDAVATITLSREEKKNAISPTLARELLDALKKYNDDPEVHVIVLTGAGNKVFCAGADFVESMGGSLSLVDRYEAQRQFAETFKIIKALNKPLVGRINGHALGGGLGLAIACDIVIAADDVKLGTPEINVGLFPYVISATLLRYVTSPKRLLEIMLVGERISAAEAKELGLVNHAVPRDQLDAKVQEIATALAGKSPATLRMGRRSFYTMRDMEFEKALEYLASMLTITTMSEDVTEGVTAFLEKRAPKWKGR
ncbi:MAG: crotonase [Dehalococcoidia bacterium]|nr:MAG: crotonase [Dehalococcoidia bacterium]